MNVSQCQAEEHFITVTGHFNCLNVILTRTFLCQFAEESQEPTKRITTPYMTKYERARVLGTRALQIRYLNLKLSEVINMKLLPVISTHYSANRS